MKDIKILDKAAVASERMKTALVRSKDHVENLMDDGQVSPSEYAEDKIRYAAEDVTDQVEHDISFGAKKAVNKGKEAYREHREEKRIQKNEERVRKYEEELRRTAQTFSPQQKAARDTAKKNVESQRGFIRNTRNQTIKTAEKTTTDPDNPQEVATVTEEKKQLLSDIFWAMNDISYRTKTDTETEIIESDDGRGNILEERKEVTKTTLYITVTHKTANQMSDQYRFNADQDEQLDELLNVDNSMWMAVLYGVYGSDDLIVQVALSQIGNVGGEPYWSWYGFGSRAEWCACFVS